MRFGPTYEQAALRPPRGRERATGSGLHFRRYLLLWLVMSVIAPLNGAVRELGYRDALGELAAHQVSSVTGSLVMTALVWWAGRRWPLPTARMAAAIGLTWLVLTVAFEFGLGRLMGRDWDVLFADYNLAKGRVWGLVLAWIAALPILVHLLQRPRASAHSTTEVEE